MTPTNIGNKALSLSYSNMNSLYALMLLLVFRLDFVFATSGFGSSRVLGGNDDGGDDDENGNYTHYRYYHYRDDDQIDDAYVYGQGGHYRVDGYDRYKGGGGGGDHDVDVLTFLGVDSETLMAYHLKYGSCEPIEESQINYYSQNDDAQGDDAQGDDAQGDDAQGDDAQGEDAEVDDGQGNDNQLTGSEQFLSFGMCSGSGKKEHCASSITHVLRVDDFFHSTASCVLNYCNACYEECNEADDKDCDKCKDQCSKYSSLTGGKDYYGCTKVEGKDGEYYYYGPTCADKGRIEMGYFYDEYCYVQAEGVRMSADSDIDNFDVFEFVTEICMDCSTNGICEDFLDSSYHCDEFNTVYIGHSMISGGVIYDICDREFTSAYNVQASSTWYMSESFINKVLVTLVAILVMTVLTGFLLVSYTYYVRHLSFGDRSVLSGKDTLGDSTVTSQPSTIQSTPWN